MKLAVALISFFALSPATKAQSVVADSARVAAARAALFATPMNSVIRIQTAGNSFLDGRLVARSDTAVVVLNGSDSLRASMARVAAIFRPAANLESGATVGGVIGAVLGALALGTVAQGLCESQHCNGAFGAGAAIGAGIGGATGAILGLGIGALTHHWEQFWP